MKRDEDANFPAAPTPGYLEHAGLWLLPEGAVFEPASSTLWVADVHFGKAASFRAAGVPIPSGTTARNLERLTGLIAGMKARRLVFLGDLLHGRAGNTERLRSRIAAWRAFHADVEMTLVLGNHDRSTRTLPGELGLETMEEGSLIGEVAGAHHPMPREAAFVAGALTLCGHLHPCIRLFGPGRDALRLRCFARQGRQIVLPAFGEFTGGLDISRKDYCRVFALAGGRILPIHP